MTMYKKCQTLRQWERANAHMNNNAENLRLQQLRTEVSEYIDGVPDPYIKRILAMRYLEGRSWYAIVCSVGGSNNEDSLRMMCKRYLMHNVRQSNKKE